MYMYVYIMTRLMLNRERKHFLSEVFVIEKIKNICSKDSYKKTSKTKVRRHKSFSLQGGSSIENGTQSKYNQAPIFRPSAISTEEPATV